MKRKVKVDLEELAIALATDSYDLHHYLDLETGQIIALMEEFTRELEAIYEGIYDEDGNRVVSLEDYFEGWDGPDWQKDMILEADRVEQGHGTRYIRVEREDPYEDYRDMERFIRRVEDVRLRERLWDAIQGRGAFRRFKDLLARHPQVQEQWYAFKNAQVRERAAEWLDLHDLELV